MEVIMIGRKVLKYLIILAFCWLLLLLTIIYPWPIAVGHAAKSAVQWAFGGETQAEAGFYYTCPMHPQIRLPRPGDCPLCGMSLVKKEAGGEEENKGEVLITPTQIQLAGIRSEAVKKRHLVKEIDTVGRIDYDERKISYVTAWIGGRIDKLFVDFTGVTIRKGHPLVSLYSPSLISTQEEYLRAVKTLKVASASQIPETVQSAKNLVKSTRQRLLWWGIGEEQIDELEKTKKVQDHLIIKAPIGGTVVHKDVFEGMYVQEGTKLFKIIDMSNMWLYADIYESEIPFLMTPQPDDYYQCPMHPEIKQAKPGNCSLPICKMPLVRHSPEIKIEITTESYPNDVFTGEIEFTDPFVNSRTRTLRVRCSIENTDLKLRANMYARARIQVDTGSVLALPENAVIHSGKRNIIMVDQGNGFYEPRLVSLGKKWMNEKGQIPTENTALPFHRGMQRYHEVLAGVKEGEKVVSPASFLLNSEAQIQGALEKLLTKDKRENPPAGEAGMGDEKKENYAYCAWEGMKMKLSAFQSKMEYQGQTLYFCSEKEMKQFMAESADSYHEKFSQYAELMKKVIKDYLIIKKSLAADKTDLIAESAQRIVKYAQKAQKLVTRDIFKAEREKLNKIAENMVVASKEISQHTHSIVHVRNNFRKLSDTLIEFVDDYSSSASLPPLVKFHCSMKKGGYWLQATEKIANPYYGKSMLRCGAKVK